MVGSWNSAYPMLSATCLDKVDLPAPMLPSMMTIGRYIFFEFLNKKKIAPKKVNRLYQPSRQVSSRQQNCTFKLLVYIFSSYSMWNTNNNVATIDMYRKIYGRSTDIDILDLAS